MVGPVIEHFGSAEVWALKLTPEWVGMGADTDIPLPDNVRQYYIPSTNHGGTTVAAPNTRFNASLAGSLLAPASCPGNNYGTGILAANPIPHTTSRERLDCAFPELDRRFDPAATQPLPDAARWQPG